MSISLSWDKRFGIEPLELSYMHENLKGGLELDESCQLCLYCCLNPATFVKAMVIHRASPKNQKQLPPPPPPPPPNKT